MRHPKTLGVASVQVQSKSSIVTIQLLAVCRELFFNRARDAEFSVRGHYVERPAAKN